MIKEKDLLENNKTREEFLERVDVLEKVKELILLGDSELATTQQVADYYEVGFEAIQSLVKDNREELTSNGLRDLTGKEVKSLLHDEKIINYKGYFTINGVKMNNRNNLLFQKQTILAVGMLLKDSKISEKIKEELFGISSIQYKIRPEINFLDKLEQSLIPFNIEGIRQYSINSGKYRIDYYIPKLNIAIEYDELQHNTEINKEKDLIRQKEIECDLECKFIRVSIKNSDEYNIGFIIKNIFNL